MFFTYRQNNSGGSFHVDDAAGISMTVVVEANDAEEADNRAQEIDLYFDGCEDGVDCECCGDRWHSAWRIDGRTYPEYYGDSVFSQKACSGMTARHFARMDGARNHAGYVHYLDGRVVPCLHLDDVNEDERRLLRWS